MGAAILATLAIAVPAHAKDGCGDVVRKWESTVSSYPSRTAEREANQEYRAARDAQRRGDNSACLDHMDRANRILREETARRDEHRTEGSGGSSQLNEIIRNLGNSLGK
jgi:hypothetical protein